MISKFQYRYRTLELEQNWIQKNIADPDIGIRIRPLSYFQVENCTNNIKEIIFAFVNILTKQVPVPVPVENLFG